MLAGLASVFLGVVGAYMGATWLRRRVALRRRELESSRNVQTERILSLLASQQPGVWDAEELRDLVARTATAFWSAPTQEALERQQAWVRPEMLSRQAALWPPTAVRREVAVTLARPPAFVHVTEGGPGVDRVVARLEAHISQDFFQADGACIRSERHPTTASYHLWHHEDGQGWRLEAISEHFPTHEPTPSSVAVGIHPLPRPSRPR
ncbi:MAG: hypothetical protein VKQ33_02430 [Candidatus Sericytochromatia bacterium]|nr:hypothetical protein [Candidatus Sericytochromatia bacterium]